MIVVLTSLPAECLLRIIVSNQHRVERFPPNLVGKAIITIFKMFNFDTPEQKLARRTKKCLQKYSSLDKPMCKSASCNCLCYITKLYISCHNLLNYLVLLWIVLFALSYLHLYFHALHYYCSF